MYYSKREKVTVPSDLSLINMDPDPFYRYKMEPILVSYSKKNTTLTNLYILAKDLRIRPQYILEYFGFGLKAKHQINYYKKRTEIRLQGFYEQQKLQRSIDQFIIDHLLCKRCFLPQLRYWRDKNRLIGDCKTCGYLDIFDPRQDNIKEFIYNNPPVKDKQEIKQQEEDDLIYGNRQIQYETIESYQVAQEQSQEQQAAQEASPYQASNGQNK